MSKGLKGCKGQFPTPTPSSQSIFNGKPPAKSEGAAETDLYNLYNLSNDEADERLAIQTEAQNAVPQKIDQALMIAGLIACARWRP
ncbi:hypothetical protein [Acidisoma cladoniae]|uniref:hypothetical protein n=1 Tax=Acidisoma cladoniae TaxID=3040935 RepID=UPI00254B5C33|nr:hypothetical protein [Acidisoma sp. PAMC 29798]